MPTPAAARKILHAIERRRSETIITWHAWFLLGAWRWCPWLVELARAIFTVWAGHTPDEWLRSAVIGAEAAVASYENIRRGSPGIIVTTVMGTEVDTTANAVEIAAFCATWKALGGDENRLKFQFDNDWMVQVQAD